MQIKRWRFKTRGDDNRMKELNQQLSIGRIAAQLLVQRGITNVKSVGFSQTLTQNDLYDPYLMKDMDRAVDRIQKAINGKEKILLYGDYDVACIETPVANLYLFLERFTDNIDYYIPDRYSEKSGISKQSIDFAIENNYTLLIAFDCGTKDVETVDYANLKNLDIIICDHHKISSSYHEQ